MHHFLINDASSKEIDVCLYLTTKQDWLGVIHIDVHQIAAACRTTVRYAKTVVQKLSKPLSHSVHEYGRKPFLSPVFQFGQNAYKLNFGMNKLEAKHATYHYMKKFSFFYTENFQSLTIAAKKLLLVAAFDVSLTNNTKQRLKLKDLLTNESTRVRGFTKAIVSDAVEDIEKKMGFAARFVKAHFRHYVEIEFPLDVNRQYVMENEEQHRLEEVAFECGGEEVLTDEVTQEILKTGKGFFNGLFEATKTEAGFAHFEDLTAILRKTYRDSLYDLFSGIHKENLSEAKAISAYLRGIMINKFPNILNALSEEQARYEALQENYAHALPYFDDENQENLSAQVSFLQRNLEDATLKTTVFKALYNKINDQRVASLKDDVEQRNTIITNLQQTGVTSVHTFKKHLMELNQRIATKLETLYRPMQALVNDLHHEANQKTAFVAHMIYKKLNNLQGLNAVHQQDMLEWRDCEQHHEAFQLTSSLTRTRDRQTNHGVQVIEEEFPF